MNAFNPNTLPVAPEFVEMLQEQAVETLRKCLETMHAPEAVIGLVQDIESLGYYRAMCSENPESLTGDCPTFDGVYEVIKTINHLAACGASFSGAVSSSMPRAGAFLTEAEKVKVQK